MSSNANVIDPIFCESERIMYTFFGSSPNHPATAYEYANIRNSRNTQWFA